MDLTAGVTKSDNPSVRLYDELHTTRVRDESDEDIVEESNGGESDGKENEEEESDVGEI